MTFLHAPRGNLSSHITETTFHLRPPSPCPHRPPHSISPSLEQARYRERAWPLSHAFWEPQRTTTLLKQQTQPLVTSASPSVQRRQSDLLRRLAVGRPARGATRAARPLDRPCRHRHHHPCSQLPMHRSNSFVGQMAQVLRTPHQRCGGDQTAKTRKMLFSSFLIPSEKRPRNAIRENELRVSLDGRKSTAPVTDIREEEADRPRPLGASSRQVLSPL